MMNKDSQPPAPSERFSIFQEIFGRIWAVWGLLAFAVTMLLFLIPFLIFCYFIPDPQKTNRFIKMSRLWINTFLALIACPLQIRGREHFKPGETYVVICNHNALIDVPVSSPGIPGGNKTIAKIEMARIPLFGLLYRTGSVLVDRKSETSRRESFQKMKEVLDMGLHMCIYPEGTRNKSSQPLKSFHNGAFRLSIQTQKELIPALIFNSRKVNPPSKGFFLLPYRLYLHFLEPVKPLPGEDIDAFKTRVFEIMENYYVRSTPS